VKFTALSANLGLRVDCVMIRGYLTGKKLRKTASNCNEDLQLLL